MSAAIELVRPDDPKSVDSYGSNAIEVGDARDPRPAARPELSTLTRALLPELSSIFDRPIHEDRISLLRPIPTGVADATAQLLVKAPSGEPAAVVLCSSPVAPDLIARAMARARECKEALGPHLGGRILEPLGEGEVLGASFAVLPFCRSLGYQGLVSRVKGRVLAPHILEWLRGIAERTCALPSREEVEALHQRPLQRIVDEDAFPSAIRQAACSALGRLRFGTWRPRTVLMHQDLWSGNVLIDDRPELVQRSPAWASRFVVIDWPGAMLRGYPFFDLVRFADSTPVTRWELAREIEWHAQLLGMEAIDAKSCVLAAAGHMASLGDHFPLASLVAMTERAVSLLDLAGA